MSREELGINALDELIRKRTARIREDIIELRLIIHILHNLRIVIFDNRYEVLGSVLYRIIRHCYAEVAQLQESPKRIRSRTRILIGITLPEYESPAISLHAQDFCQSCVGIFSGLAGIDTAFLKNGRIPERIGIRKCTRDRLFDASVRIDEEIFDEGFCCKNKS